MAENYVLLETIELTQSAASVTFDNIPQSGYTDLKIVMSARSNRVASGSGATMTFNGVSTGYSYRQLYGFSGGVGSVGGSSTGISFNITAANFTANSFESIEFYIPNYTASTNKSISIDAVRSDTASAWQLDMFAYLWSNSAAISTITIDENNSSTFVAGCTFSLYGVAAVGTTPTVAPKATGGNIVANDGTYWYHAFLTSGTFTPQTNLTCDYLVVAGGGGGGFNTGGGGGAGGLRTFTAQALTADTNYACTIGAGGARGTSGVKGSTGAPSTFNSTSSSGGGGGGSSNDNAGAAGGSGGGAARGGQGTFNGGAGNAGGYSPIEGYKGGDTSNIGNGGNSGGGGGAGAAAANVSNSNSTAGGIGATSSLINAIAAATYTGVLSSGNYYYAGGGGGGNYQGSAGAGGIGGGGAGAPDGSAGSAGIANTGGGGGGGNNNDSPGGSSNGYQGGSGIVVIRYAMV